MFDADSRDMTITLSEMERQSRLKSNFDQIEARQKLETYIQQDGRFQDFDAQRLAARVQECRQCGAILDLDDPRLKGEPPRPLDRRHG